MVVTGSPTVVAQDDLFLDGEAIASWIGGGSPCDVWFRLIQGRTPSPAERRLLEALFVALADHGETPASTQAARLVASTGVPLQGALAAGFLAFGDHHAGAIEGVMEFLQEEYGDVSSREAAAVVGALLARDRRLPGFGHRIHRRDPRVAPLLALRRSLDFPGRHVDFVLALEKELTRRKNIALNVDGICGALLSDLGFPYPSGRAFFMAGRLPGLLCHVLREQWERRPFSPYRLVPCEKAEGVDARKRPEGGGVAVRRPSSLRP